MPVPATPIILGMVIRDKAVYLNWTIPAMGESEIIDYIVQRKLENEPDSCFAVIEAVSKSDLSVPGATIAGSNGVGYVFRVAAKNKFGAGEYSITSSVITSSAVPSKPATPICTPGNGQITLNWQAPSNGGSAITDYVIQVRHQAVDFGNFYTTKGGGTINDGISTATTYIHTGLTNGGTYGYRIAAKNATGQSVWSTGTPVCNPATVPQTPFGLIVTPHNGYINLSWQPQGNGGSIVTGYNVQRKLDSQLDSSFVTVYTGKGTVSGSRILANVVGVNGIAYVFKVASINAAGTGAYTNSSRSVTPCTVPDKMNAPTCTAGNNQLTLNWQAPGSGGSPITDYVIQYQYCHAGVCSTIFRTVSDGVSASTSYVLNNLINGYAYRFRMWAVNAAGAGSVSFDSAFCTPMVDVPTAPTNIIATLVGNTSVRLNFTPPIGPITGYVIGTSNSGVWGIIDSNYQMGALIYGLTEEPHTFVVAAKNTSGIGDYSIESNSVTPSNKLFDKASWKNIVEEPYLTWLNKAADRWDRYIKYNASARAIIASENPGWNGIALGEYSLFSDSTTGELAATAMMGYKALGGKHYNSISYFLEINDYYRAWGTYTEKDWINILTHELGHALGIGIFWDSEYFAGATSPLNFFLSGNTYTNSQAAFNSITSLTRTRIPLEKTGGSGTASGHWENSFRPASAAGSLGVSYPGFKNEIMIGYFAPNTTFVLSRLTIKTLVDFGWEEINIGASEGNPTLKLSLTASVVTENIPKCGCPRKKIVPQQIGEVENFPDAVNLPQDDMIASMKSQV